MPTILVATVMVAGIFAFMPVQQASTVHESIQASTAQVDCTTSANILTRADDAVGSNEATDTETVQIRAGGANFILMDIEITMVSDPDDDGDALSFAAGDVNVDGVATPDASWAIADFLVAVDDAGEDAKAFPTSFLGVEDNVIITITEDQDDANEIGTQNTYTVTACALVTGNNLLTVTET